MSVIVSIRLSFCGLHPDGKAALVFQAFSGPHRLLSTPLSQLSTLCVSSILEALLRLIHRLPPEAISGKALLLRKWVLLSTQSARTQEYSVQGRISSHLCLLCAAVHSPRDLSLKSCSYHMPLTNVPPTQRYPDKKGLIKNTVRFLWRSNPKCMRPNASLFLFISFLLILSLQTLEQESKSFTLSPYIRTLNCR